MKKYFTIFLALITITFTSCSNGQPPKKTLLTATEFASKIQEISNAPIIDVRTPDEFSKGHLLNAKNIDWNGDEFDKQMELIDKSTPIFVYCLSGGRSASATKSMMKSGFQTIYELDGGIMKWRAANLPETTEIASKSSGMTKNEFDSLTNSDKLVLVDFYAEWCVPCKKMKPYLEEISKDMAGKVIVVRINVDDNKELTKELKIDVLPVLHLYKNNMLKWENIGFIEKEDVVKQLQ